jgi:hypothetical protein
VPFTTARYFLRQPVAVQVRVKRHMQVGLCFQTYFEFNSKKGYGFTQRDVTCQHILKDELLQFRINLSVYSFNVSSGPPIQCVS